MYIIEILPIWDKCTGKLFEKRGTIVYVIGKDYNVTRLLKEKLYMSCSGLGRSIFQKRKMC